MASEHEHTWMYVADESAPVQPGKYIALNMKLSRFCTGCDARQELLSQTVLDEQEHKIEQLEQQLAQAQKQIEALQKRDDMLTEANAFAVTRYAQARALLARFAGMLDERFRTDGSLAGEGFNVSLFDQLQFCREVRAFLAQHQEPPS